MLGVQGPTRLTPEDFKTWAKANRDAVLGQASAPLRNAVNFIENNPAMAAALAAGAPLAFGVAQTAIGALAGKALDKAVSGAGALGSAIRNKVAALAASSAILGSQYGALGTAARMAGMAARGLSGPVGWTMLGLELAYTLNNEAKALTGTSPVEQLMRGDVSGAMQTVQEALQKSGLTTTTPENPNKPPLSSEVPPVIVGSAGDGAGGGAWGDPAATSVAQAPTNVEPTSSTNVAQVGSTGGPGSAGDSAGGYPPDFNIINGQPWGGSPTVVAMNTGPSDAGGPVRVPAALGGAGNAVAAHVPTIMAAGAAPVTRGQGPVSPVGNDGNPLA